MQWRKWHVRNMKVDTQQRIADEWKATTLQDIHISPPQTNDNISALVARKISKHGKKK